MGSSIRINLVTVKTENEQAAYSFAQPVTFITGSIGVGKSSLLELLKYGLGGTANLMPAIRNNVRFVEVEASFQGQNYRFIREMGETTIDVIDTETGEIIGPWSVTNRKYMRKASQQLLGLLGLPADLRIPKRRVKPTSDTVGISFFDLYKYIYLGQNGIDTSVVGHTDRNLDNKRRAVFELLYGLNSPELIDLAVQRGKWLDREKHLTASAEAVKDFLSQGNEPTPDQLRALEVEAQGDLESAHEMLQAVRTESEALLSSQREIRDRVGSLRSRLSELSAFRDITAGDVHKSESLLAQLRLEQQAMQRVDVAHSALSGLEFSACPRCLQEVANRSVPDEHCLLCMQPESVTERSGTGELKRLSSQILETQALLSQDENALNSWKMEIRRVERQLAELTMELERSSSELISPQLEEVQSLSMRIARLEAKLEQLEASSARWSNYNSTLEEARAAASEAALVGVAEADLQATLTENRTRVSDLSRVFNATVRDLRLPWYQSAGIDPDNYMPVVNGEHFEDLSVGGARKTIVNLAYHLANLQYAILHDEVAYPTLLIVDSPRKNVGQTEEDMAVGRQTYLSFLRLQAERGSAFQIIVADNSIPGGLPSEYSELHFTYDAPVVPGVPHPGESVERVR
ncbi:AAA family ATPase [Streptomyces sp. NPDC051784]|uniref:AAA family ATPase n=1 Tax=Streptomyces sp. NPDC051784 TaxID=3155805 RepID=UPI00341A335E